MPRSYHVYILSNTSLTLYIGVTGRIAHRLEQHRRGEGSAFARRYHVGELVHLEEFARAIDAIEREKQLKRWSRRKKLELIKRGNPTMSDLRIL